MKARVCSCDIHWDPWVSCVRGLCRCIKTCYCALFYMPRIMLCIPRTTRSHVLFKLPCSAGSCVSYTGNQQCRAKRRNTTVCIVGAGPSAGQRGTCRYSFQFLGPILFARPAPSVRLGNSTGKRQPCATRTTVLANSSISNATVVVDAEPPQYAALYLDQPSQATTSK
ncbi:hypothetical protein LZ30DRAFT_378703 [Colletotrichum cereale]|nr:hypothetical protein LZ30DRAFT_378703 [Colletotrichum cereale]